MSRNQRSEGYSAARDELTRIMREIVACGRTGTIPLADSVHRVAAAQYCDPARWRLEIERVFKRLPLMLAMTVELPAVGDYKALDVVGVPVLIVRGDDRRVRAFVNMCSHRGAQLVEPGRGNAKRFVCPYHAWTYATDGALTGVFREREFGTVERSCNGLAELPATERAGFVWVTLDPHSTLDIEAFLAGYDRCLALFGFDSWHCFASRVVAGPNWKVAYDGYLDFYHLPILHRNSFGANMFCQAMYHAWGPHQRVSTPSADQADVAEADWTDPVLLRGVWTIFPHVSIAGFEGGGRGVLISQLFPGDSPSTSYTVQNYLMEQMPEGDDVERAWQQVAFLERVVRDEDYVTGLAQQRALATGAKPYVMFGRNEGGGQRFHRFLDAVLDVEDAELEEFLTAYATKDRKYPEEA